jgi:major outer membrane protein
MTRRCGFSLGIAVLGICMGTAHAGEPETISYLPRALPAERLTAPVPGLVKEGALRPPANDVPAPVTTPPAFTPGSHSLCTLCEPRCDGNGCGCSSCSDGCGHYFAGAGAYFVQPFWTSNPAYFHFDTLGGIPSAGGQQDFGFNYELVPLVWIGCKNGDGLGCRARWWKYDQSAHELFTDDSNNTVIETAAPLGLAINTSNNSAAAPEILAIDHNLDLTVLDVEITQDVEAGCWWLTFSGGGRYCHMSQTYNAVHVNSTGTTLLDLLVSSHDFNGFGLTTAMEAHRPLGLLGMSLYGSVRGTLLYGDKFQSAVVTGTNELHADYAHQSLLPVLELELGMEWRNHIWCWETFVQIGVVGQAWFGAGNASRSNVPPSDVAVLRGAGVDDATLGFFGGVFTAGIRF